MFSSLRSSLFTTTQLSKHISSKMTSATNTNQKFAIQNLFNVEDWICVVSGGATGIGLMISQAFANNGAKVYITGRRAEALQNAKDTWGSSLLHPKGQIIPMQCYITNKDSIRGLVEEIQKKEKYVDLLVNNAGINTISTEVEKGRESAQELSKELFNEDMNGWEDIYRTNVIGYVTPEMCRFEDQKLTKGARQLFLHDSSISAASEHRIKSEEELYIERHQYFIHVRHYTYNSAPLWIQRLQGRSDSSQHTPCTGIAPPRRARTCKQYRSWNFPFRNDG